MLNNEYDVLVAVKTDTKCFSDRKALKKISIRLVGLLNLKIYRKIDRRLQKLSTPIALTSGFAGILIFFIPNNKLFLNIYFF